MSKGYVYILSNPSMPGIVKIGKTVRDVDRRAIELWTTGVPTPFVVEHSVLSPDCDELESTMHQLLHGCRVNGSREFFRPEGEVENVDYELDYCLGQQLGELISQYAEGCVLVSCYHHVPDESLDYLAEKTGCSSTKIASAMSEITPDEIRPAIERLESRYAAAAITRKARIENVVSIEATE